MSIYECEECAQEFEIDLGPKVEVAADIPYPRPEKRHYHRDGDEPCFGRLNFIGPTPKNSTRAGENDDKEQRCYLRGLTPLGIFNTIIGCLFNTLLTKNVDRHTGEVLWWSWDKATDFPPTKKGESDMNQANLEEIILANAKENIRLLSEIDDLEAKLSKMEEALNIMLASPKDRWEIAWNELREALAGESDE